VLTVIAFAAGLAACATPKQPTIRTQRPAREHQPADLRLQQGPRRLCVEAGRQGLSHGVPEFARDGVRNFLRNLRTPIILANEACRATATRPARLRPLLDEHGARLGGLVDVGARHGIPFHDEDFRPDARRVGVPDGPT